MPEMKEEFENTPPTFRKLAYLVNARYVEAEGENQPYWIVTEADGDYEYSLNEFKNSFYPDSGDAYELWQKTLGSIPQFTRIKDEG